MAMINFDNAATTFPKPLMVRQGVLKAIEKFGGNPGRGGHSLSIGTAGEVYKTREKVAKLFGAEVENVVFTLNCTSALNFAIKGLLEEGDHVIISSLEHNSVARPVFAMREKGVSFSIAEVESDDERTLRNFEELIKPNTKCIVSTVASNVTGKVLPYKRIAELCKKKGIAYIADGAQACGVLPLKMSNGFSFLCMPGHKGLYGPAGTGVLISSGEYTLKTIIEGGTGATSEELSQTPFLPEKLESGTVNTVGIIGLGSGIDFLEKMTLERIYKREERLCEMFVRNLKNEKNVKIYRDEGLYVPIVAFNLKGVDSKDLASYLNDNGFGLRGGFHCAYLAHKSIGTADTGAVRFSPSVFNSENEVYKLCNVIKKYKK